MINKTDIMAFAEQVKVGDCLKTVSKRHLTKKLEDILSEVVRGHAEDLRVKEKYAHIAVMENGETFSWADLYMWNMVTKRKYTKRKGREQFEEQGED